MGNCIEYEDEDPKGNSPGGFEIGEIDASPDTPGFTLLVLDQLLWRRFVRLRDGAIRIRIGNHICRWSIVIVLYLCLRGLVHYR